MFKNTWIKGILRTIIIKLLGEHGRMYGYEITKQIEETTDGNISLTFGAIYPILHKLENASLVKSESIEVEGRFRKYYTLTKLGEEALKTEIAEFRIFSNAINKLVLTSK